MREAYYDWRAPEYDDFWKQQRRYSATPPGWFEERDAVLQVVASLPPRKTLDVACGTGFVTRRLRGEVTGLDHSPRMLAIARRQAPGVTFIQGSGLTLPFADGWFERVFASHFYGHLEDHERDRFLAEARRVASELVILDAALHQGAERAKWQERELIDGTQWVVYKRFFSEQGLLSELGGGETLFSGTWFICVRSPAS